MIMKCQVSSCSHCCSFLHHHCSSHFGCPHYLSHFNLSQHPPLALLNKTSSSHGQRSSADEMNMDVHEEFVGGAHA